MRQEHSEEQIAIAKIHLQKTLTKLAHFRIEDCAEQSASEHSFGTAEIAKKLAEKIGLDIIGELMGLGHDFGKWPDEWQKYFRASLLQQLPPEHKRLDHSTAGAQYIDKTFNTNKNYHLELFKQIVILSIVSHHQGLIDCLSVDGENNYLKRIKKDYNVTNFEDACVKVDKAILDKIDQLANSPILQEKVEKFIKNFIEKFKECSESEKACDFWLGLLVRLLFSILIDADRLDTERFMKGYKYRKRSNSQYVSWDVLIERFEDYNKKFQKHDCSNMSEKAIEINKSRSEISEISKEQGATREKGIFRLTAPTGAGKTLAYPRFSIEHARRHKMDRIFYICNFTSIIDQNARIHRKIFNRIKTDGEPVVLEHHCNLIPNPREDRWQNSILAENWDAAMIETTAVQFFEALFGAGTRGVRRMHQMINSIIVFDEVQTIPIKLIHMFNNAINFLVKICGCTVILCTATQPLLNEVDRVNGAICLSENPELIPNVQELFNKFKRIDVIDRCKPGGWSIEEVSDLTVKEMEEMHSVLVVVNTKKSARRLYEYCKEKSCLVYHLSTNMCPAHRTRIISKIRKNLKSGGPPLICISTQLIEAGVDLDFGSAIRYLGGIDSIAQVGGRSNRHGLREKGRLIIINPSNNAESLDGLENIRIGGEVTRSILFDYKDNPNKYDNDLIGTKSIQKYFKGYYGSNLKNEMSFKTKKEDIGQNDDLLSLLSTNEHSSQNYIVSHDGKDYPFPLRQSFDTAADSFSVFDMDTDGVLVLYGKGKKIKDNLMTLDPLSKEWSSAHRKAQRYSVNMFPKTKEKLIKKNVIEPINDTGIFYVKSENYDKVLGLIDLND